MGFGFNIFFAFIFIPSTIVLLICWLIARRSVYGKIIGFLWLGIGGLASLSYIIQALNSKTILRKEDFKGEYIINTTYYNNRQSKWQYSNYRFEIKDNDSIYFYVTNDDHILKTFKGTISTTKDYQSERLIINMEQPSYHILNSNPTIYRSVWSFYIVFNSPKFGNVFFKKGHWKKM